MPNIHIRKVEQSLCFKHKSRVGKPVQTKIEIAESEDSELSLGEAIFSIGCTTNILSSRHDALARLKGHKLA